MTLKVSFEVNNDLVILMTQMHVQVRHGYRSISVFGTKGGRFRMTEVIRLALQKYCYKRSFSQTGQAPL